MKPIFLSLTCAAALMFTGAGRAMAKAPGFSIACSGSQYITKGRGGLDIKPSLNVISSIAGRKITLFSCFRTQGKQNSILRSRGCRPFGKKDCSGSVARVSQHTNTIAADIQSFAPIRQQCQILAKGRSVAGGRGGVGTYPGGSGHFDMGSARSWNRCKGVTGGGDWSPRSQKVSNRLQKIRSNAGKKCNPTKKYPSCCGPKRRARGLCQ